MRSTATPWVSGKRKLWSAATCRRFYMSRLVATTRSVPMLRRCIPKRRQVAALQIWRLFCAFLIPREHGVQANDLCSQADVDGSRVIFL